MCININKDPAERSHVYVVYNPSIHNAGNRSEDTQFFIPFVPYVTINQTDSGLEKNTLFIQILFADVALFRLGNMDQLIMI